MSTKRINKNGPWELGELLFWQKYSRARWETSALLSAIEAGCTPICLKNSDKRKLKLLMTETETSLRDLQKSLDKFELPDSKPKQSSVASATRRSSAISTRKKKSR